MQVPAQGCSCASGREVHDGRYMRITAALLMIFSIGPVYADFYLLFSSVVDQHIGILYITI
jgi:hypothetical protein